MKVATLLKASFAAAVCGMLFSTAAIAFPMGAVDTKNPESQGPSVVIVPSTPPAGIPQSAPRGDSIFQVKGGIQCIASGRGGSCHLLPDSIGIRPL